MLYHFLAVAAIIAASADAQDDNISPISAAALGLTPQQSMARGNVLTTSRLNTVDMRFEFSGTAAGLVPDPESPGEMFEFIQQMFLHLGTPANGGPVIMQIVGEPQSSPGSASFQLNGATPAGISYTDELLQGNCYVNLTTSLFPGGEMAGQILSDGISVGVRPTPRDSGASAVLVSLSTLAACALAATAAIM